MKLSIIVIFEIAAGIPSDIFVKPPSEKCNDFQILPNPRADQDGYRHFTKYVNVLVGAFLQRMVSVMKRYFQILFKALL